MNNSVSSINFPNRLLSRDVGKIRIAIAGMGKMGNYHIQAIESLSKGESEEYYKSGLNLQISKLQLCGICETDSKKSVFANSEIPVFANWQELLLDVKPDLALIATPTQTHYNLAFQSLQAGVHTFVEKPLVTRLNEFKKLTEVATLQGCRLMSGHVERYNPVAIKLRAMVAEKQIDVANYHFQRSQPYDSRIPDDIVTDKLVHDLDLAQYFFGPLKDYQVINSKIVVDQIHEITLRLRHNTGVEGELFVSWLATDHKCREIRISCKDGSFIFGNFADKQLIKDGTSLSCTVPSWVKSDNNQLKDELADFVSFCMLPDAKMPVFKPLIQAWEIEDSIRVIEEITNSLQGTVKIL